MKGLRDKAETKEAFEVKKQTGKCLGNRIRTNLQMRKRATAEKN